MKNTKGFNGIRRLRGALAVAACAALPLACNTSEILEVVDPDIILDANSLSGAVAMKNGVILRLAQAVTGTQGPDALFVYGGLITDEWRSGDTFVQRNNQDQRIWEPQNTFNAGPFRALNRVRVEAIRAIAALRQYAPADSTYLVGQMFALTAYTLVNMAEHYCNGTPLSELQGTAIAYGTPLTNDSVFILAIAFADSALANLQQGAAGTSARVRQTATIIKARALLDRGQFAAAAALVTPAAVATTYRDSITHSLNVNSNQIWSLNNSAKRYTMVDVEGGVGIDFMAANDPRLPRRTGSATDRIFDSAIPLSVTRQGIYGRTSAVPIVSGVEARLIEAEAALQAGQTATWLTAINTLRTNQALYPPLGSGTSGMTRGPALTNMADPGTQAGRENAHFRERAYWMFGTGHRLGDMRRLLRQYGRTEPQVYPTGAYYKGGTYGDAIQMSIPDDELNNPNSTGCIDRNP